VPDIVGDDPDMGGEIQRTAFPLDVLPDAAIVSRALFSDHHEDVVVRRVARFPVGLEVRLLFPGPARVRAEQDNHLDIIAG